MSSIEEKICEYGQKKDTKALQRLMSTINEDEVSNLGLVFHLTYNILF